MISVVIPLYNKEKHIEKCIRSVIEQTFLEIEIIVINDGSTDKSLENIYKIKDERVFIINQNNEGPSSARNKGILKAKYDLIALLDADDFWETNFLSELFQLTILFPHAILYGSKYLIYFPNTKKTVCPPIFKQLKISQGLVKNVSTDPKCFSIFSSSSIIFRKESAIKAGLQNELIHYGEDMDFLLRMSEEGEFCINDKFLAYYTYHNDYRITNKLAPLHKSFIYNWFATGMVSRSYNVSPLKQYFILRGILPYFFNKKYKVALLELFPAAFYKDVVKKEQILFRLPYPMAKLIYHFLIKIKSIYWNFFYKWRRPTY